ncbi:hypothetical protein NW768_007379 [Fusarium equiseti]|uniref:Uncharacterized protein n=1 Tax=Fusarium equiseti TaxID=61235 RepID=A0ABQ8R7A7_FUSEQ|nr:hypothetical protein NW768_007379 [Fusarium equiseti]
MSKPAPEKTTQPYIALGDDMPAFNLVLDPSRRVKHPDHVYTADRNKKLKTDHKGSKPDGKPVEPPTPAQIEALDKYHADMRKFAEDALPERNGLLVPCEDWFCTDRGYKSYGLSLELADDEQGDDKQDYINSRR